MSLPKPEGYLAPPPPSVFDVLRTARVLVTDVVPAFSRLGIDPDQLSTDSYEGLRLTHQTMGTALRRVGVTLQVHDVEHVPPSGGLILMWNQASHLDHLILGATIPRPFVCLYNNEIARFPIYGKHMRRSGHLHVDRTDETQWRHSVAQAAARAQSGACILVSPEGTRSWDGALLPMKRGAFLLAETAAQPIVCVSVIGAHKCLPRGCAVVRKGPVHVIFSQPFSVAGSTTDQLMARVIQTFEEAKQRYSS